MHADHHHTTATATVAHHSLDAAYHALEQAVADRIAAHRGPLFTTTATPENLWERYLGAFPAESRPYYTCHACRHFLQRFGGLVTLDETGHATPFLWANLDIPAVIAPIADALHDVVARSRVTGAFRWAKEAWGVPSNVAKKNGATWTHLHGIPTVHHERRDLTPAQQMAALAEDVGILQRSLEDYSLAAVEQAVRVLQSGTLTRSEKAEGVAVWFLGLHQRIAANPKRRHNIVWQAVASAPPGFAHVRTTVVSTLLDDIVAGKAFDEVSRRWSEKLHPLQYQRPQAAPRTGQIEAAERKVKDLGLERSLVRRFATLADVLSTLWTPQADGAPERTGGIFDALKQNAERVKPMDLPAQRVTWRKFAETVLPTARSLDINVPYHGSFYGLVTAADLDAPPIIQWDGLEGQPRNPVTWYFYNGGSPASRWGVTPGWTKVSAVFLSPFEWQEPSKFSHFGRNIFFAIPNARDTHNTTSCLFPETLRNDLRDIRAVVEAFSKITPMTGAEEANANGLAFGGNEAITLRITTPQGPAVYTIDRWE